MSYQGLAFVLVLGVGVASALFYLLRGEPRLNTPHRTDNQYDWRSSRYGNEESESQNVCSICIHDIKRGEERKRLLCGHTFHTCCIDEWFTRCRSHQCPNCRRRV